MVKYMLHENEVREFMEEFRDKLRAKGYNESAVNKIAAQFYTENVIIKYSEEEQDMMWQNLYDIIMSPGGIRFVLDNMDYMPIFEHRRFACLKSSQKDKNIYK